MFPQTTIYPANKKSTLYETKKVLYNMVNLKMGGMTMNCMKCGRETVDEQVFCTNCLEEMEKYPVRPGTVILLPRHKEEARKPMVKKKAPPSLEEQVKMLKKLVRRLAAILILLLLLLGATGYFTAVHLLEPDTVFLPGQNYSSITTTEAPTGE